MSGSVGNVDITRVIVALQELTRASYLTQQTLAGGLALSPVMPSYAVANLPTAPQTGQLAFATNGRNSGELAGAGSGTLVMYGAGSWKAVWSGVAVTV